MVVLSRSSAVSRRHEPPEQGSCVLLPLSPGAISHALNILYFYFMLRTSTSRPVEVVTKAGKRGFSSAFFFWPCYGGGITSPHAFHGPLTCSPVFISTQCVICYVRGSALARWRGWERFWGAFCVVRSLRFAWQVVLAVVHPVRACCWLRAAAVCLPMEC